MWIEIYIKNTLQENSLPFLIICDEDKHLKYFKMLWCVSTQPYGCNGWIRKEGFIFTTYGDVRHKNNHKICIKKAVHNLYAPCQSTKNTNRTICFINFRVEVNRKLLYRKEVLAPPSTWWWIHVIKELKLAQNLLNYTFPQLATCHNVITTGKSYTHRRKKKKAFHECCCTLFSSFCIYLKNVIYAFVEGFFKGKWIVT